MPEVIQILYVGSDNLWTVDELTNLSSGNFINSAQVTVRLLEEDRATPVSGESWPKSMAYVAGSDGKYETVLTDVLGLRANRRYYAETIADGGAGLRKRWVIPCQAIEGFE